MTWPNSPDWCAGTEATVQVNGGRYQLTTLKCGVLKVPSGKLVCCDPFAAMEKTGNVFITVPVGEYHVEVTLADVSPELDGSHIREAYASLLIDESKTEIDRRCLQPTVDGKPTGDILAPGEFFGFGVDAGTACFVDAAALEEGMPDASNWYEELFENDTPECWFDRMDDPNHVRAGIADIPLPESKVGNNLILFHSGWGDGFYPVIGGYDESGSLVAVHIDFFVASAPEDPEEAEVSQPQPLAAAKATVTATSLEKGADKSDTLADKPWWKFW